MLPLKDLAREGLKQNRYSVDHYPTIIYFP